MSNSELRNKSDSVLFVINSIIDAMPTTDSNIGFPICCSWRGDAHLRDILSNIKQSGETISNSCTKLCMVRTKLFSNLIDLRVAL